MKILIIQHKMIGDVLLTSLLCENFKKKYPNSTVDYLINRNTLPVLENNPYIDNKIVFDEQENKSLIKLIKFSKQVNNNKYDIVIDAYSKIQSWIDVFINDAPRKISYKKFGRSFLYTDNVVKHKESFTHLGLAIEHRLALLSPLGIDKPIETNPKLYLTEKEKLMARNLFKAHGVDKSKKTIMISLLGSKLSKTYPLDKMTELVEFLGQNYDVNILFNYFPKQLNDAKIIYNNLSENTKSKIYFDLLAEDLRSFIAIMNECDIIIGNDGGAVNMAKAVNKKSFVIFSPYVSKNVWATFEDNLNHISVHLKDYFPKKYNNMSDNKLKRRVDEFYSYFDFSLFKGKLKNFLNNHVE